MVKIVSKNSKLGVASSYETSCEWQVFLLKSQVASYELKFELQFSKNLTSQTEIASWSVFYKQNL